MGNYISPLDFQTIFLNYFLGNSNSFIFAFVLAYSFAGAYFQFSNRIFLILLAIGGIIMSAFIGQGIYFFLIMVIGFVIFKILGSYFNR